MGKPTDVRVTSASLFFLPVETRVPLKFGPETLTFVTCARVRMRVTAANGKSAWGWGETPLSVQWVWPGSLPYSERHKALMELCITLAQTWADFSEMGHPLEVGYAFQKGVLPSVLARVNERRQASSPQNTVESMPWLAALVCCSPFDIALHDACGALHDLPIYETYGPPFMNYDLAHFLEPAIDVQAASPAVTFKGRYPRDFLVLPRPDRMPAWHLVGGLDPVDASELTGTEPDDGYPTLLSDWIARDGLKCLKVKLRGNDCDWDYRRLVKVGEIACRHDANWLSADFNCTVRHPDYVNAILDRLMAEHPRIYGMILYVEQPFPYDLESNRIDVHSVSARKPLFMDESAHNWELVRLGRQLGWTGVALKTCKTQTEALLSLCWAKAHGMTLMVQDLTNPMLAQISHVLLAAHAGTIMGVETNAMQFYPDASLPEQAVHQGLYQRREGQVDLSTLHGPGFGYRLAEIDRELPDPVASFSIDAA